MVMDFPRSLRPKELDLILFVLPQASQGYNEYRSLIDSMVVLGEGRRGKGNIVLGTVGDIADTTAPLASVIAHGVVETTSDTFTITVRECVGGQIDVEIVSNRGDEIPDHFEEKHRWTYSTWSPGKPSPATQMSVRETTITGTLTLACARKEKRVWLHDSTTGMNHLIPITNFYNELMLHKRIRDPKIALNSDLFFDDVEKYSDDELKAAFVAYNRVKKRVKVMAEESENESKGLKARLRSLFMES